MYARRAARRENRYHFDRAGELLWVSVREDLRGRMSVGRPLRYSGRGSGPNVARRRRWEPRDWRFLRRPRARALILKYLRARARPARRARTACITPGISSTGDDDDDAWGSARVGPCRG